MSNYAISLKRTSLLLAAMSFTALLLVVNFAAFFSKAAAADLTARSLALSSTLIGTEAVGDPGDATNGAAATHTFNFVTTDAAVATVVLRYCTAAVGTCNTPAGLSLASAASSDGAVAVGDFDAGTGNQATVTLSGGGWVAAGAQEVDLTLVTNPTALGAFFVRIVADDDEGTVASAITEGITITARVAETLGFSTTGEIDTTNVMDPTAACIPLTGSGAITLGDPTEQTLSLTQAYDNYSAFRVYTNAGAGVAIQYHGDTLRRSPTTDINAIGGTEAASAVGTTEQFGLAIDTASGPVTAGTATPVTVASDSSALDFDYIDNAARLGAGGALTASTNYATGAGSITNAGTARFSFVADTPTSIATSTGYVECKTAAVRYIANISPTTTSGTYTTTIVYSAVPTY